MTNRAGRLARRKQAPVAIAGLRAQPLTRSNEDDVFVRARIATYMSEGYKEDERQCWSGIPQVIDGLPQGPGLG